MTAMHAVALPSAWLLRWAHLLPGAGARALDLACGSGRHLRWLSDRGLQCTGVDRDVAALNTLSDLQPAAELVRADIENGPWPLPSRRFDLVVVTNYLWRPLWPQILDSLSPGGWLVYETFAAGNETVGKPSRPDFLLQPGELLQRCAGLHIVAFEQGFLGTPDRFVQRIVAQARQPACADGTSVPARHPLTGPSA